MTATKTANKTDVSKISDIRWNKYYESKRTELASKIEKMLIKSKVSFDPKVPSLVAKLLIQRKKK